MSIEIKSNAAAVRAALDEAVSRALEEVGLAGERFAKKKFTENGPYPFGTGNTRNSITHVVEDKDVYIGANTKYAIYIEMGTGVHAEGGGRQTPWCYQDDEGNWHRTSGMRPRPFIKPAATEHTGEYMQILKENLS